MKIHEQRFRTVLLNSGLNVTQLSKAADIDKSVINLALLGGRIKPSQARKLANTLSVDLTQIV